MLESSRLPSLIADTLRRLQEARRIAAFFVDTSLRHGAEGTILAGEGADVVSSIIGTPTVPVPSTTALRTATGELLARGRANLASEWYESFASVVRTHRVHDEHVADVDAIIEAFAQAKARAEFSDPSVVICAAVLARQAAAGANDSWRERVRTAVLEIAREFDSGRRDGSVLNEVGAGFVEIALALAARHDDPAASARELAGEVDDLVRAWPALA